MTSGAAPVVRVQELIGRIVLARNGRHVGRIEELRAEQRGHDYIVTDVLLGSGGLRERFAIVRHFRPRTKTIVVRWDQIDLSDPERPRLTCTVDQLRIEEG
jgi:sporulation protein YlmC with PRC-barrel domain